MQTQHLIIIATGSALGLLLMTHFIRKAIRKAFARGVTSQATYHRKRVAALTADITRLVNVGLDRDERHQREIRALKADHLATYNLSQHAVVPIFTEKDQQLLLQVHASLSLAKQTWRVMPGTEPMQAKAERQAAAALELAARIMNTIEPAPVYEMPQNAVLPGAAA
ncbi:hypothetical protein [Pseudomonas sp. Root562]|uniref:hypothetical protein n=1 Tax=Pseudomonas sp. Root562 TaxID=1736561 RepID=UPI000702C9CA|nr:hypothetical protein [Pseudomonas sp. Root562]KQZ80676.1 hypothetical protein ASD60_15185 [Pseudomonas sp. Root562]